MNISIYNVSTPSGGFPTNSVLDPPQSPVSGGLVYASIYLTQGMLLTDGSLTMFNGLNGSLYLKFYKNVTDIYTQHIVDSVEFTNHPTPNDTRTTFAFDNSLIWNHQSGVYIVSWQQTPIASNYLSIEITDMNGSTNWSWCGFLNAVFPPIIIEHTAYSNSIYIKWNMNVGLFFVEYAPNMIASIMSNDNYTITGLTRNTTYSIRVGILYVPYINNVWSGYVNVTTLPTVPDAPTGLTAISYQNLAVKLSWTAPNDGGSPITNYVVQYSTDQILWTTFPHSLSNATTITVTGLTNGTFYYFKVAAVNSIGVGVYSTVTNATPLMVASCGITGFVPGPPPWSRAGGNNCPNCDSNYGTSACGDTIKPYSTYALDERRKAEILKYKKNGAQMSKAQQYSMLSRNALTRKKSWATQTQTYTNPNVDKLPERESEGVTVALECIQPPVLYSLTSDCDVPGPVIPLYIDAKIPLYNYKMQVTPSSGGKQVNKMFAIT